MKKLYLFLLFISYFSFSYAQVLLDANSTGNTYELITSVLAPGAYPIETPDCSHPEFGDHIDMVFDANLNTYVFRFHVHKTPDNDRCINFDRQRNEIKTYAESPANLIGTVGETVEYKWKFKIDANFQASSSFTHLHQLKAVGGPEEGMPLFTLTARKGNPDKLELRYAEHLAQETIHEVDLTPFKGTWVQVVETVSYGESGGSYSLKITKVSDGSTLMEYSNNSIRMWKTNAEFIRPKWGIYRSLNNPDDLRDEILYFANFVITESNSTGFYKAMEEINPLVYPNPTSENVWINSGNTHVKKLFILDLNGKVVFFKYNLEHVENINLSNLSRGVYFVSFQTGTSLIKTKMVKN